MKINTKNPNVTTKCDSLECPADSFIISQARKLGHPFCLNDVKGDYSVGYIRNRFVKLRESGRILPLLHTCPRFHILKEHKSRFQFASNVTANTIPVTVSQSKGDAYEPKRVWSNLAAFLESLPASDLAHIHDVNLCFNGGDLLFVDNSWTWESWTKCWHRSFQWKDGWGYSVKAYSTTKNVTVSISCKFYYSISGLLRLVSKLGEVKAILGEVPEPMTWRITMWHYGRDFRLTVRGKPFEVCLETFSGCLGRIYYKHDLNAVRFEEIHSPQKSIAEVFEQKLYGESTAEDAKKKLIEGFTCVEVVLSVVQMDFALKLSKENDAYFRDLELTNLRIAE